MITLPDGDLRLSDGRVLFRQRANGLIAQFAAQHGLPKPVVWTGGRPPITVLAALEPYQGPEHGLLLHVSVSYPGHAPSWRDLRTVKEALFGDDEEAMIVLPKRKDYVNHHPNCHHIWQIPPAWQEGADRD